MLISELFHSDNISPILFSMYLNDLETYFEVNRINGVPDDTIIMSDCAESFQAFLDTFHKYCMDWKLTVNESKTKIIIFGARKTDNLSVTFGERTLEFVDTYKYLGAVFSKSGSFLHARKHIAEQAKKAMYLLNKRIKNLDLPIDLQLKLFDNTILPILTYGCEIYGFEDYKMLEVVQNQFLRCLANFRKSTPLNTILGEFGRYPLEITIKSRMIGFWVRILTNKHSKLSYILYRKLIETPNLNSKWVTKIKQILDECGMSEVWLTQTPSQNLPKIVSETLRNQFCQKWNSDLNNSSKGRNYGIFKESINLEEYFLKPPPKLYTSLAKFRTANHRFPCEVLRWQNIELSERRCHLCDDDVGDEMHYLLICPFFSDERPKYIKRYYFARPNILKFKQLLNTKNMSELRKLCLFTEILMKYAMMRS